MRVKGTVPWINKDYTNVPELTTLNYRRDPLICGPLICGFWLDSDNFSKIWIHDQELQVQFFFIAGMCTDKESLLTLCRARDYIIVPGALNSHSSKNTHRISKIFIFLETLNNPESTSAVKKSFFPISWFSFPLFLVGLWLEKSDMTNETRKSRLLWVTWYKFSWKSKA
jgi:hypothetical protein